MKLQASMSNTALDERGLLVTCRQCGQRNRLTHARLHEAFRCGNCQAAVDLPGEPVDVPNEELFLALVTAASIPILTDFWAPWCGPCKMVAPEVAKFASEAAGRLLVAKVNTEASPALAQRFGISGIPTFIVFRNGGELARQSGALSASQLKSFVSRAL